MYSRDPAIAARIAASKEAERLERFAIYQRGQNQGMGRPVRAKFGGVKATGLLILGGCAAVALLAWGAVLDKAHGAERELTCYSTTVTDGDTFKCDGRTVRLHGIDAPECSQYPCRDSASRRLQELLGRSTVYCRPFYSDRYGRTVATCRSTYSDDIGADLRLTGVARTWDYDHGAPKPYPYGRAYQRYDYRRDSHAYSARPR